MNGTVTPSFLSIAAVVVVHRALEYYGVSVGVVGGLGDGAVMGEGGGGGSGSFRK